MWLDNKSSITVIITYQILNMYFHLIFTAISKTGTVIISVLQRGNTRRTACCHWPNGHHPILLREKEAVYCLPFVTLFLKSGFVFLCLTSVSIISSKTNILWCITYMWNLKKYNKVVSITKKKPTHRYRERTSGYQWGGKWGGKIEVGD